jgi:hypothetical protein
MDDLMRLGKVGEAGGLIILSDIDVQLAISLDRNGIGNNRKLSNRRSDIAIAGDFQLLLGKIQDALDLNLPAADDQVFSRRD